MCKERYYAELKGVKIKFRMEECALDMGQQREQEYAATKDVQNKFRKAECVLSMEQTSNDATVMDAPTQFKSTLAAVRRINSILP